MEQESPHCVDIAGACPKLLESPAVRALVAGEVGQEHLTEALERMARGDLSGDLGDTIHDALLDPIDNDATIVWSGLIGDEYPVEIGEFHGVYWVHAQEYDKIGLFLDKDRAIGFACTNWGPVRELLRKKARKR
jgi:hypothetical protein